MGCDLKKRVWKNIEGLESGNEVGEEMGIKGGMVVEI